MKRFAWLILCFVAICFSLITGWAYADTFTVANLNDSGEGSLRWAIEQANINPGSDTISFNIPGPGPHTIQPASPLPLITDPVVIDGYTQPGASPNTNPIDNPINAVLQIELDGSMAGFANGIYLATDSSIIRGLAVNRFQANGVYVDGSGNVLGGNFIGTNVTGTADLGNSGDGVSIMGGAQSNTVGGTTEGERNVISGNDWGGVFIHGQGTDNNKVSGNYIGTDVNGTTALWNSGFSVCIHTGAQYNTIGGATAGERNIISGCLSIEGSETDNNTVLGNYIGTDVNGTAALGNGHGIIIMHGAQSNTIGGTTAGERNVISGNNGSAGVIIFGAGTDGNVVSGNYIGTDVDGISALGNSGGGVLIRDGAQLNIIGGSTSGARNIISGNDGHGVFVDYPGTDSNVISGNYIGTDVTGTIALGNAGDGVSIRDGAKLNTIGGTGNTIAFNSGDGVMVSGIDTDYNKISRNSMHDNTGLGINLADGGNDEIPAPAITSFGLTGNTLHIEGTGAGANATVEAFEADSSESGEGETYLGSLAADGSGNFSGDIDVTGKGLTVGDPVVATTTHINSNTSEFGSTGAPLPRTIHVAVTGDDATGDGSADKPYRTIQKGIDKAYDGCTVLVADGTYSGTGNVNLDFGGKAIAVESENGAENCIIDCEGTDHTRGFYFHSGEGLDSVVDGFTIRNGNVIGDQPQSYNPVPCNRGAGIYCYSSSPTIINNIITDNVGNGDGGGICCWESSPIIAGNIITRNEAGCGGGIVCHDNSSPEILNNSITRNIADAYGGGIYINGHPPNTQNPRIINNTLTGNWARHTGGGINCGGMSSITIINTILWNNVPQEIYFFDYLTPTVTISYSDIQGGEAGIVTTNNNGTVNWDDSNMDEDPLFVNPDPANGDYHLSYDSPCIGAGIMAPDMPHTDIEGSPRPNPPGSNPDMGAYETSCSEPLLPMASFVIDHTKLDFKKKPDDDKVHVQGKLELDLDKGDGVAISDDVIVTVGPLSETITMEEKGNKGEEWEYRRPEHGDGNITNVTINWRKGSFDIRMDKADLTEMTNPVTISVQIGDDVSSESILMSEKKYHWDYKGAKGAPGAIASVAQSSPLRDYALYPNYPNPFNPETWIPYQLAEDMYVRLRIYSVTGKLVRILSLGHKPPGFYISKDKAAHWDGKNEAGEQVSSGIYFYTIQAGDYTATKKMIIAR